eukprot:12313401-Alexandrium_andersonii.AAC.1
MHPASRPELRQLSTLPNDTSVCLEPPSFRFKHAQSLWGELRRARRWRACRQCAQAEHCFWEELRRVRRQR